MSKAQVNNNNNKNYNVHVWTVNFPLCFRVCLNSLSKLEHHNKNSNIRPLALNVLLCVNICFPFNFLKYNLEMFFLSQIENNLHFFFKSYLNFNSDYTLSCIQVSLKSVLMGRVLWEKLERKRPS